MDRINTNVKFTPYCSIVVLMCCTVIAHASPERLNSIDDDWHVNVEDIGVCHGAYERPIFTPSSDTEASQIDADKGTLANEGLSTFSGNVVLQKNNERLYADRVKIARNNKSHDIDHIHASGHLFFEQPASRLQAGIFDYTGNIQLFELKNVRYRFYDAHLRGSATKVTHIKDEPYYLYNTTQTSCEPHDNFWQIKAKNIIINTKTDMGTAYHATLYIKKIPIFYTPYMTFPLSKKRKSGLLFPSFSYSKKEGFAYTQPYYFNLAPNYDATVTARTIGKRGEQISGEFRYLTHMTSGQFQASVLDHDSLFERNQKKEIAHPTLAGSDARRSGFINADSHMRRSFDLLNDTNYSASLSSHTEYHYVSDPNYLNDMSHYVFTNNQQLNREFTLHYNQPHWQSLASTQDYLTLQPFEASITNNPYRIMPRLQTEGSYPYFYDNLSGTFDFQYTHFVHPDNHMQEGERYWIAPTFDYLYRQPYFYIRPKVQLNLVKYQLTDAQLASIGYPKNLSPSLEIPIYSIESGLFLERNGNWRSTDYTQTLEPKLFYVYIPYRNQNDIPVFDTGFNPITPYTLMLPNRFSSVDRFGDTHRIGLSLMSRFLNDEGVEKAEWQVAQLHYFKKRRVALCRTDLVANCISTENPSYQAMRSDIYINTLYHFNEAWLATANAEYDDRQNVLHRKMVTFNYHPDNQHLLNIGYQKTFESPTLTTTQAMASFAWHLNARWNILGHWYYDLKSRTHIDSFAGVEYESCCWAIRVGGKHYLKLNNAVDKQFDTMYFFEFILKGLAGVGESYQSIAENTIDGYTDRLGNLNIENLQTIENH